MSCVVCAANVERAALEVEGVAHASVNFAANTLTLSISTLILLTCSRSKKPFKPPGTTSLSPTIPSTSNSRKSTLIDVADVNSSPLGRWLSPLWLSR